MSESRNKTHTLVSSTPGIETADLQQQLDEANRQRKAAETLLEEIRNVNKKLPEFYSERFKKLLAYTDELRNQIVKLNGVPAEYSEPLPTIQVENQVAIEKNIKTEQNLRDRLTEANNKLSSQTRVATIKASEYRETISQFTRNFQQVQLLAQQQSEALRDELNNNKINYDLQLTNANEKIGNLTDQLNKANAKNAELSKMKTTITNTKLKQSTAKISELTAQLANVKAKLADIEKNALEARTHSIFREAIVKEALDANAKLKNELDEREFHCQAASQQLKVANTTIEQLELQLAVAKASVENIRDQSQSILENEKTSIKNSKNKVIDELKASIKSKQNEIDRLRREKLENTHASASKRKRETDTAMQALTDSYEQRIKQVEAERDELEIDNANHFLTNVLLTKRKKLMMEELKNRIAKKDDELSISRKDAKERENYIVDQINQIADVKQELIAKTQVLNALAVSGDTQAIICDYVTRISRLEAERCRMQLTINSQMTTINDLVTNQFQVMPGDKSLNTQAESNQVKTEAIGSLSTYSPTLFAKNYPHLIDDNAPPTLTLDDINTMQLS